MGAGALKSVGVDLPTNLSDESVERYSYEAFKELRSVYEEKKSSGMGEEELFELMRKMYRAKMETATSEAESSGVSSERKGSFLDHMQVDQESRKIMQELDKDVNLEYVLSSILGEFFFTNWVFSPDGPGSVGSQLFGLILEVRDFQQGHKAARAECIIKRFNATELGINELKEVGEMVAKDQMLIQVPADDLFDEVSAVSMKMLEDGFFHNFKKSKNYADMIQQMAEMRKNILQKSNHHLAGVGAETGEVAPWLKGAGKSKAKSTRLNPAAGGPLGKSRSFRRDSPKKDAGKRDIGISLGELMQESLGLHIFKKFCREQVEEHNLLFWLETKFFKLGFNGAKAKGAPWTDEVLKAKVTNIYSKYILPDGTLALDLSTEQRNKVKAAIEKEEFDQIDGDFWEELHQDRFEYLQSKIWPSFRESTLLKQWISKIVSRVNQKKQNKTQTIEDREIDLDGTISSLLGEQFFMNWVFSPDGPGPIGGQLFGLLLEVRDFKQKQDKAKRAKRFATIMNRFNATELDLPPLLEVQEEVKQNPTKLADPPSDALNHLQEQAMMKLKENHFDAFKASSYYAELVEAASAARRAILEGKGSKAAESKQAAEEALNFEATMKDKLGLHIFKKHCRDEVEEQNVLFWLETTGLKRQVEGGKVSEDALTMRIDNIYCKYLPVSSKLELNTTEEMRQVMATKYSKLQEMTIEDKSCFFDELYDERIQHLKSELWPTFESSSLLQAWKHKILNRIHDSM